MKILKTNGFITERMKINPITRAELDKARQERFIKIDNPTFADIKPGNVVCLNLNDENDETIPFLVFDITKLPGFIQSDDRYHYIVDRIDKNDRCPLLVGYNKKENVGAYVLTSNYEHTFPFCKIFKEIGEEKIFMITAIYDANINTMNIHSFYDLKNEWYFAYKKIENYKQSKI